MPKSPRLKLVADDYAALHQQVLETIGDARGEGSMRNLEVHHLLFQSHSGFDVKQDLTTPCSTATHGLTIEVRNYKKSSDPT